MVLSKNEIRDKFLQRIASPLPEDLSAEQLKAYTEGYLQGHNTLWIGLQRAKAVDYESLEKFVLEK